MPVTVKRREISEEEQEIAVKDLPAFYDLEKQVGKIVNGATWMERYGWDGLTYFTGLLLVPTGLLLTASPSLASIVLGIIIYGCGHSVITARAGHLASHGALCQSPRTNRFLTWFLVEFMGSFSSEAAFDIHLRQHHPHTNIIGIGDSSVWRAPFLPRVLYLFAAPVLIPVVTPLVSLSLLWGQWTALGAFLVSAGCGLAVQLWPLVAWCGYSLLGAVVLLFTARAVTSIPYVHINIFQHIGLPMYDQASRPARLFQMSSGVLNLEPHPFLDWVFGPSLIECHVEHHLFPRLSDRMCQRVKPIVRQFLLSHGLPYNEKPYSERLGYFYNNYERLMVRAPPITHFVGLQ